MARQSSSVIPVWAPHDGVHATYGFGSPCRELTGDGSLVFRSGRLLGCSLQVSKQIAEQLHRVVTAIGHCRGQVEVIGPAGKYAAASIAPDQQKLDHNLFARVLRGKSPPPGEAAHVQQLLTVVEHVGPAD